MKKTSILLLSDAVLGMFGTVAYLLKDLATHPQIIFGCVGFSLGWLFCSLVLFLLVADFDKERAKARKAAILRRQNRKLRRIAYFTLPWQDEFGFLIDQKGRRLCPACWRHKRKVRLTLAGYCPVCGCIIRE